MNNKKIKKTKANKIKKNNSKGYTISKLERFHYSCL